MQSRPAGKARVHELARELGLTSKQILNTALDLGIYVKSASSTVEAADARRIGDTVTGRGQALPRRRNWPHQPIANNPYFRPVIRPRTAPPAPREPRLRPDPGIMSYGPRPDDDSFDAALRRTQAASRPTRPSRPPKPKPNPIVDIILARSPMLRWSDEPIPGVVHEWARMWTNELFEPDDVAAWMDAGLKGNEAHRATELCREGWTPVTWASRRAD